MAQPSSQSPAAGGGGPSAPPRSGQQHKEDDDIPRTSSTASIPRAFPSILSARRIFHPPPPPLPPPEQAGLPAVGAVPVPRPPGMPVPTPVLVPPPQRVGIPTGAPLPGQYQGALDDREDLEHTLDDEEEYEEEEEEEPVGPSERQQLKYLLCGAVAGAVSRTCTAPLDRLKVLLQTQTTAKPTPPIPGGAKPSPMLAWLNSFRLAWIAIYRDGGLKSFWRGNGMNCVKIIPESAIKFYVFERTKLALVMIQGLDPADPQSVGMATRFVAGGVGGLISQFTIYPIETIKTRVMATTHSATVSVKSAPPVAPAAASAAPSGAAAAIKSAKAAASASGATSVSHQPPPSPGSRKPTRTIPRPPLSPSFARGGGSSASGTPLAAAGASRHLATAGKGAAAAAAAATAAVGPTVAPSATSDVRPRPAKAVAVPASAHARNPLLMATVREMWAEGGLRPFFRGLGPSLFGIVPYAGIDLGIYESLKSAYLSWDARTHAGDPGHEHAGSVPVHWLLVFGPLSGAIGATSVYPLSLVRTRLQAQGTPGHPERYAGALDAARKTFQREGIRGFYKGLAPTLLKVIPAASISYACYEGMKDVVGL